MICEQPLNKLMGRRVGGDQLQRDIEREKEREKEKKKKRKRKREREKERKEGKREREKERERGRERNRFIWFFFSLVMALQRKYEKRSGALQRKNFWEDCR